MENEIYCRGCHKTDEQLPNDYVSEQHDAYGISTGYWCDGCYNSDSYPYRKDKYYDYFFAGERMEDDY